MLKTPVISDLASLPIFYHSFKEAAHDKLKIIHIDKIF